MRYRNCFENNHVVTINSMFNEIFSCALTLQLMLCK